MIGQKLASPGNPTSPVEISHREAPVPTALENSLVCFAANAVAGRGGQGEFLRQMVYALDQFPHARVLSRFANSTRSECIDVPFDGWRGTSFRTMCRIPVMRGRRDFLNLLSDVDFDSRTIAHLAGIQLFDGVMGQCCHAFEMLSKKNIPLVLTALNTHIDSVAEVLAEEHRRLNIRTPSFVHPRMRLRVAREIERAWRIRTISELAKQTFIERGVAADKIEVVLPSIDLDWFHPVEKPDDIFRVLAVLTIDPRKGIYYLLQAFEKAAIPHSELVIIGATGDSWSRRMLQQFTARLKNIRVQAADVLKDPLEKTYGQASVFVHPAIEDGFALAVGQALACGKPTITTRQTGAAQLIRDGLNGFVLECRDVDGLVDRLRLLARNESLLRKLSAAAPQAVAHLGYPAVAQQVARLYNQALVGG
jgi:glycosyltransferase involved in cell wall biosynthesis